MADQMSTTVDDTTTVDDKTITYSSYLQVPRLMSCQKKLSHFHDEYLFIVMHQVFELWFGVILEDLHAGPDSVRTELHRQVTEGRSWRDIHLKKVINSLQRVVMIMKLVIEQFHILETMPPLNFVDFRDYLTGGSGFQSLQFRKIEKLLGVKDEKRQKCEGMDYKDKMAKEDKPELISFPDQEGGGTIFDVVNEWLSIAPGIDDKYFWDTYKNNEKVSGIQQILDEKVYKEGYENGHWKLSRSALKGALLVVLKQDCPLFQQPYQILTLLMDIDAMLMKWRSTHIQMVHRMIGQKPGTGGSSGYGYLCSTYSDNYKVFTDLFNLATYLRPREEVPNLRCCQERKCQCLKHFRVV